MMRRKKRLAICAVCEYYPRTSQPAVPDFCGCFVVVELHLSLTHPFRLSLSRAAATATVSDDTRALAVLACRAIVDRDSRSLLSALFLTATQ